MAFVHGKGTHVWYNAVDLTGYLRSAELAASGDVADTTTFANTWRTFIAGLLGATFSVEGLYDPALVAINEDLGQDDGVLTYSPGAGGTIGDTARLIPVLDTAYGESDTLDDAVSFAWEAVARDSVEYGIILHTFTEDTNTTTGATYDGGAASSTGWTAHLHVSAVDGGSWVVKLQHATASNFSDGADVTGGAFAAVTGAGGQRLVSASATTTLNRYVRYVATRTGGSAGDGITFGLSLARGNQ